MAEEAFGPCVPVVFAQVCPILLEEELDVSVSNCWVNSAMYNCREYDFSTNSLIIILSFAVAQKLLQNLVYMIWDVDDSISLFHQ